MVSIDDEVLSMILYEVYHREDEWVKEEGTPFKQTKEKLTQDDIKFTKFSEAVLDIINLKEGNPATYDYCLIIYITSLISQRPM